MGEMKRGPLRRFSQRAVLSSALRDRKFAFLASYRLSLAQAQVALPPSELGWMAPNCAPHIPSWQEYFQLMRKTPRISPTASRQMEAFLERYATGYVKDAGERQGGAFREAFATIAAEARRILEPAPVALAGATDSGSSHAQ